MSVEKSIVDAQIKSLGEFREYFTKKEIAYLPEVLSSGEKIYGLTSGMHNGNTWLIVVTNIRVLFLDKGMLYGLKQVELPLKQVSAIAHKVGMTCGQIEISSSAGSKKIEVIAKKDVLKISGIISDLVNQVKSESSSPSQGIDVVTQLERLAKLKEQGILTEEEFQKQKTRILS